MILVVADTTPLRYLVETEYEYLLPQLFTKILIPGMVAEELRRDRTPAAVRRWAQDRPAWIEVRIVDRTPLAHEDDGLDRGEWEAIELAEEMHAGLLLIDEREGARIAREHGRNVTGTLGLCGRRATQSRLDRSRIGKAGSDEFSAHARPFRPIPSWRTTGFASQATLVDRGAPPDHIPPKYIHPTPSTT